MMRPTVRRLAQYMTRGDGHTGVQPWRQRVEYETYKSKFGPEYKIAPHFHGINPTNGTRYAYMAGLFGVTAGIGALFFADGIPRIQKDILQKLPFVGEFFHHEVPPEDNPF